MSIFERKEGINLLPGFVDAEVFWHQVGIGVNLPIPVIEFFNTYVFLLDNEPLLVFHKSLQRMSILTQTQLSRFSSMEEWIGDLQ